jgi:hypothetical protein
MDSTTEILSYDYSTPCECGFSKFPDGSNFKYNEDGEICLSTDCSTWAKRLLNNLPLDDYIASESFVPPSEFLSFPEFGTRERRKGKKETVGNYIEDCEFCGDHMEETFSFKGKLICENCNDFLQKEKCMLCKHNQNLFSMKFVKTRVIQDSRNSIDEYCRPCWKNVMQLADAYFNSIPNEGGFSDEEEYEDLDACPRCGADSGGSLCYFCRVE